MKFLNKNLPLETSSSKYTYSQIPYSGMTYTINIKKTYQIFFNKTQKNTWTKTRETVIGVDSVSVLSFKRTSKLIDGMSEISERFCNFELLTSFLYLLRVEKFSVDINSCYIAFLVLFLYDM